MADVVPAADGRRARRPDGRRVRGRAEAPARAAVRRSSAATAPGDTGELEPVAAEIPDDLPPGVPFAIDTDPEAARYAPREPRRHSWLRRLLALLGLLGIAWMAGAAAWSWTQHQYYVGEQDGVVTIFRGVQADVPGVDLSHPYETSNVQVDRLDRYSARSVEDGIGAGSLDDAERTVQRLAAHQTPTTTAGG